MSGLVYGISLFLEILDLPEKKSITRTDFATGESANRKLAIRTKTTSSTPVTVIFVGKIADRTAWAEVERLHLPINPLDWRRAVTFGDLALHYAEHELVERSESIHPKAHTSIIRL